MCQSYTSNEGKSPVQRLTRHQPTCGHISEQLQNDYRAEPPDARTVIRRTDQPHNMLNRPSEHDQYQSQANSTDLEPEVQQSVFRIADVNPTDTDGYIERLRIEFPKRPKTVAPKWMFKNGLKDCRVYARSARQSRVLAYQSRQRCKVRYAKNCDPDYDSGCYDSEYQRLPTSKTAKSREPGDEEEHAGCFQPSATRLTHYY